MANQIEATDKTQSQPVRALDFQFSSADFAGLKNLDYGKGRDSNLPSFNGRQLQLPELQITSDPFAKAEGQNTGLLNKHHWKTENDDKSEQVRRGGVEIVRSDLDNAVLSGDTKDLEKMLRDARTGKDLEKLQDEIDSFNRQHENTKIDLSLDPDRGSESEPSIHIRSKSENPDIGCGGHESSYDIYITPGSARAFYSSSIGIRSVHNKPVDADEALDAVQRKMNGDKNILI